MKGNPQKKIALLVKFDKNKSEKKTNIYCGGVLFSVETIQEQGLLHKQMHILCCTGWLFLLLCCHAGMT
jgi:hypothetical protein